MILHSKLTVPGLAILEAEVDRRVALTHYKKLAQKTGLSLGTVNQIMARLIRERRKSVSITQVLELNSPEEMPH